MTPDIIEREAPCWWHQWCVGKRSPIGYVRGKCGEIGPNNGLWCPQPLAFESRALDEKKQGRGLDYERMRSEDLCEEWFDCWKLR